MAKGAEFQLEDVAVCFADTRALRGIDLHVRAGEAVALLGPSGAGKTTLLRLLNGTVRPTQGRVLVNGQPLGTRSRHALRMVRAAIGFVHQDLSLIPSLRVSQNVIAGQLGRLSFFGSVRAMLLPSRPTLQRVRSILDRVGIGEKIFERTGSLSGGERQRVAIARALFQEPAGLLADEPVSSVDPARARDTMELLTRISREESLTLCTSIHNLELAREFFPRLIGMRGGVMLFDRPADEVGDDEFRALYELAPAQTCSPGACPDGA